MGFYSLKMSLRCKDDLFFPFCWVYPYVFFLLEFFRSFLSFFLLIWVHPHVFFLLEGRTSSSSSMLTLVSSVDPVVFSDLSNSGLATMGVNQMSLLLSVTSIKPSQMINYTKRCLLFEVLRTWNFWYYSIWHKIIILWVILCQIE